jgi:hypothetical protein
MLLALCMIPGVVLPAASEPMLPDAPPPFMPGAPMESPALKALRKDLLREEAKVDGLRITEKRLMAEAAEKEAARAQAKGQLEQAGFLREQAKAFRQDADLQAQRVGLQEQLRQAWQSGDTATAMSLMQRGRRLEEQTHAQRLDLGLSMHESMLGHLKGRVRDDLKALEQGKQADKTKERVAAGQQALALIGALLKDTQDIRKAETQDDAQALAGLLRASEKHKAGLFPLLMKMKGMTKPPKGMLPPLAFFPGGPDGPGEGLMPPPDGFMPFSPDGPMGQGPAHFDSRPAEAK